MSNDTETKNEIPPPLHVFSEYTEQDYIELSGRVISLSWFTIVISSILIVTLNALFTYGTNYYVGISGNPLLDVVLYLVPLWLSIHGLRVMRHVRPRLVILAGLFLGVLFISTAHLTGGVVDSYLSLLIQNEYGHWITQYPSMRTILVSYGHPTRAVFTFLWASLVGGLLSWWSPRDLIRVVR